MPHSVAHSVASTANASRGISITGPSPALTSFEKAHPLDGPPSEWLYAGTSRGSNAQEVKGTIAGWDKEWAKLAGKEGKE